MFDVGLSAQLSATQRGISSSNTSAVRPCDNTVVLKAILTTFTPATTIVALSTVSIASNTEPGTGSRMKDLLTLQHLDTFAIASFIRLIRMTIPRVRA
jgi:hypothetical protein